MVTAFFPKPMPSLPVPGQQVRWHHPEHIRYLGWEEAFGSGPFEVIALVDHKDLDIPPMASS